MLKDIYLPTLIKPNHHYHGKTGSPYKLDAADIIRGQPVNPLPKGLKLTYQKLPKNNLPFGYPLN